MGMSGLVAPALLSRSDHTVIGIPELFTRRRASAGLAFDDSPLSTNYVTCVFADQSPPTEEQRFMPKKKFKITNAGSSPDSQDLVDCHIEETDNGYELVAKRVVLASTTSTTPPFDFPSFSYEGWVWTMSVSAADANSMSGGWSNNDSDDSSPAGDEDTWTAQGSGAGEPDDEAERASA
jgi:hypothetical protein